MEKIDAVVIGAGVVGLAVARALALEGREVVVLEQQEGIGGGISSRNSEVIHAGIYYPTGSLKARLCVRGRALLYDYCASHGVEHQRCGKLIVATAEAQNATLNAIAAQARANGVDDLAYLSAQEAQALEPALSCTAALLSPSTGIVDSHGLMLALQGDLERAGGAVALRCGFVSAQPVGQDTSQAYGAIEVLTDQGYALQAACVINAAGLAAPDVAQRVAGMNRAVLPQAYYAKGNYFILTGRAPFSHLIYPVPEPGGLGVHLTLDLGQQAKFGPDVQWVGEPNDYQVDPARGERFYSEVRRYWPGLPDQALQPGYAGIRPKISAPGQPAADFVIQGPQQHGVPGWINLFGIESPGLTSCLAIAEQVVALA